MPRERLTALLQEIEQSRLQFEAGYAERRFQLTIRLAIRRFALYHQKRVARYVRRYGKRPETPYKIPVKFGENWNHDNEGWRNLLMLDGKVPFSNAANADICLRENPILAGLIATHLDTGKIMLKHPLPLDFWELANFETRQLTEADVSSIQQYLQILGLRTLTREDALGAIRRIARENGWRPQ